MIKSRLTSTHDTPANKLSSGSRRWILLEGDLSARAARLVTEWASLHQAGLMDDWELARQHEPLRQIEPLE